MKSSVIAAIVVAGIGFYLHSSSNGTTCPFSARTLKPAEFTIVNLLRDPVDMFSVNNLSGAESFIDTLVMERVLQYEYNDPTITLRFRLHNTSYALFDEKIDCNHSHLIHIALPHHLHRLRDYASTTGRLWLSVRRVRINRPNSQ